MNITRLFRRGSAISTDRRTVPRPKNLDIKDILAFIIALYQLFMPLVIALLIVGGVVAAILSFLS